MIVRHASGSQRTKWFLFNIVENTFHFHLFLRRVECGFASFQFKPIRNLIFLHRNTSYKVSNNTKMIKSKWMVCCWRTLPCCSNHVDFIQLLSLKPNDCSGSSITGEIPMIPERLIDVSFYFFKKVDVHTPKVTRCSVSPKTKCVWALSIVLLQTFIMRSINVHTIKQGRIRWGSPQTSKQENSKMVQRWLK